MDETTKTTLPVETLEYGRPERSAGRTRDLVLGLLVSLFLSVGVGCVTFGLIIVMGRIRDEQAAIGAVGAALITAAFCLIGLMIFLRRA